MRTILFRTVFRAVLLRTSLLRTALLRTVVGLVALALAVIFTVEAPLLASPASAKPIEGHLIICTAEQSTGPDYTAPIILSGCDKPWQTGGSGTSSASGPPPFPILWMTGRETSFGITSQSFPSPSRCPAPLTEFDFVGRIDRVQGPWTKHFLGDTVAFDDCLTGSFAVAGLVPGTVFTIG